MPAPWGFTQLCPAVSSLGGCGGSLWSQGLFQGHIVVTGIHDCPHNLPLSAPLCHIPCATCLFSLWLLTQSGCYVVAVAWDISLVAALEAGEGSDSDSKTPGE